MDAFFLTDDPNTRKQLIGSLVQSFGCVYVCLWSYYFPRPSKYVKVFYLPHSRSLHIYVHSQYNVYVFLFNHTLYLILGRSYLISLDGYYNEAAQEASSSSGSLAISLFHEYRQSVIPLKNG